MLLNVIRGLWRFVRSRNWWDKMSCNKLLHRVSNMSASSTGHPAISEVVIIIRKRKTNQVRGTPYPLPLGLMMVDECWCFSMLFFSQESMFSTRICVDRFVCPSRCNFAEKWLTSFSWSTGSRQQENSEPIGSETLQPHVHLPSNQ